jgi:Ca2+-binding EF-hand superfamily protein
MLTQFQKRKLITLFNVHDIHCNGKLEAADFTEKAVRMGSVLSWDTSHPNFQALEQGFQNFWQGLKSADTNGNGVISYEEWWAWWDNILSSNLYTQIAEPIGKMAFMLCEPDAQGIISKQNFIRYYEKQCDDTTYAAEAYAHLTSNETKDLTYDRLNDLLFEYFHSNDSNAAGNWLFGKF